MLSKKVLRPASDELIRKELEVLYARRSTVDTLIQSLEQYARYSIGTDDLRKKKTA
ncbi:MAG: hypothetical protein M1541_14515 [Acidobacteria bacterium]|nr:hypothetical protein [Acidobacteriota bacterium]